MNNTVQSYLNTYEALKPHIKWKVSDKRIIMMVAAIYILNDEEIQIDRFLSLAEKIKSQSPLFSPLRSHARYTTAAVFDVKLEHPAEEIQSLLDLYERFRSLRFGSGIYTYHAATILLTSGHEDIEAIIRKAKEIYNGMKQEHTFLTSSSDYPLATLLALDNKPDIINHIEGFYRELNNNGFRKGNDLQFLSHILALGDKEKSTNLISRAVQVFDAFARSKLRAKPIYYPVMGMLALLPQKEFSMDAVVALYDELNEHKDFKWQKDMNVMLASSIFVSGKLEQEHVAETSLNTILEAILEAQQVVMITTMAAVTAANTSSNSN
ncbi:DUF4003 family protein [Ornithinibacillus bavariensis]|uniref:DUF4003 domain-containing protein n=1 Tax=Ornithinibacillus bavariensis TaxID=545502 RepID=A0A919XA12_9BACI|nr:DUF4003 family protein [Ornithinibacillus bavariensis]GIO26793.1 hypothetical protein J43TS3_14040 [Ornithinibacillus bavariensis]